MSLRVWILSGAIVAIAGCHSSCDERSGASPVVDPPTSVNIGSPKPIANRRPVMRNNITAMPVSSSSREDTD